MLPDMFLHPDRLFSSGPNTRKIARTLYGEVRSLPIVSLHGHTQAAWFAANQPFPGPAQFFVQSDHYIFRMLDSQGVSLEDLEIGHAELKDARSVWPLSLLIIITCSAERQRECGSTLLSSDFSD
jgi:glucuronate isomerase